jgi:hypothetical protein
MTIQQQIEEELRNLEAARREYTRVNHERSPDPEVNVANRKRAMGAMLDIERRIRDLRAKSDG